MCVLHVRLVETKPTIVVTTPDHARTIADLPDEYLRDIGPVVKKVAIATGAENYNVVQVC
jgi:hypothetical protein